MKLILLLLAASATVAPPPKLIPVDTGAHPLKLAAPAGWGYRIYPPRYKDGGGNNIATIEACPGVGVTIGLHQEMKSPEALLAEHFKGMRPSKVLGWSCIVREAYTDAMCAGRVKGLKGIVNTYFATTSLAPFRALGGGQFAAQVLAGIRWTGGDPNTMGSMEHERGPEDKALCGP